MSDNAQTVRVSMSPTSRGRTVSLHTPALRRNRGPCIACQRAKRRCDNGNPSCARCTRLNLGCIPSRQAQWKVTTVMENSQCRSVSREESNLSRQQSTLEHSVNGIAGPSVNETFYDNSSQNLFFQYTVTGIHPDDFAAQFEQAADDCTSTNPILQLAEEGQPQSLSPSSRPEVCQAFPWDQSTAPSGYTPQMSHNDKTPMQHDTELSESHPLQDLSPSTLDAMLDEVHEHASFQTVSSIIDNIAQPMSNSDPREDEQREYLQNLWSDFTQKIVPTLSAFGADPGNPLLRYLIPMAEKDLNLMVAILAFSQVMKFRASKEAYTSGAHALANRAEDVLTKLEQHDNLLSAGAHCGDDGKDHQALLAILSTILICCMSFVATSEHIRFLTYTEHATIICHSLFKTMAEDDTFLYLAKLLGFMQTNFLFTQTTAGFNPPDYLGAALELHVSNSVSGNHEFNHREDFHFRDLDMFSGMSASLASILYSLGTLVNKVRHNVLEDDDRNRDEVIRTFQKDADSLEIRLRRHVSSLKKQQFRSRARNSQMSLLQGLNSYNKALLWSAWAIFLTVLKSDLVATPVEALEASTYILDACADVSPDDNIAALILFPLFIGGMLATNKVYQEFVLTRLVKLENICVTDTQQLASDLKLWWSTDQQQDVGISFSSCIIW